MKLADFDRVVVMAVDLRYPDLASRTVQLLRDHGAADPQVFLNGRGLARLDPSGYDLVHAGEPPEEWRYNRTLWDYARAYRAVVRRALDEGVQSLLIVEDDVEFSPNFHAVVARAAVPDDWQLLYYGAMHFWASVPAVPAGPYVVGLNGGQLGCQAVGWRPGAMRAFLNLPVDRPVDNLMAALHGVLPSYSLEPAVVRQAVGVESVVAPGEPFSADFVYTIRK